MPLPLLALAVEALALFEVLGVGELSYRSNVRTKGQFDAIVKLAHLLFHKVKAELIIGILLIVVLGIDDVTSYIEGCRTNDTAKIHNLLFEIPCSWRFLFDLICFINVSNNGI